MGKTKSNILIILSVMLILLSGMSLLQVTDVIDIEHEVRGIITGNFVKEEVTESEEELVEKCKSDNLEYSVSCIMDEVDKFYKYSETNDKIYLTYDQLKKQGGDCYNYARFYKRVGEAMGFSADIHFMEIPNRNKHVIATISSENGYCHLDNGFYNCYDFT